VLDRASKAGAPSEAFCTPQKLRRGTNVTPVRARQLAVVAWISAIGLMSALSMTASGGTGFVHPTNTLLGVITER